MVQYLMATMNETTPIETFDDLLPVTVYLAQPYLRLRVRDLSPLGMVAVILQPVEVGSQVVLELYNPVQCCWYRKTLRVLHLVPLDDGEWQMGGVFYHRFTDKELEEIMER